MLGRPLVDPAYDVGIGAVGWVKARQPSDPLPLSPNIPMGEYLRLYTPGATYFFTVVTHQRQPIFQDPQNVQLLRDAFRHVKQRYPFTIDAMVVLPDHLHALWSLPLDNEDFSTRWRLIKEYFTRRCDRASQQPQSVSRSRKGERAVWQRRFWEHRIRDAEDFANHVEYIHYNPVKHGWADAPGEWPYTSFHRYVAQGVCTQDWGRAIAPNLPITIGHE